MDYAKFAEEAREADTNSQEYTEVPVGEYECAIKKMELKETQNGDDLLSVWWEILEGEYKGQLMFQNIFMGGQFGTVNYKKFMQSIKTDVDVYDFSNRNELEDVIAEVFDDVTSKYEYLVESYNNKKNFKEFKIKDIYNI